MRFTGLQFLGRELARTAVALPGTSLVILALVGIVLGIFGLSSDSSATALSALTAGTAMLILAILVWAGKQLTAANRRHDLHRLAQLLGESETAYILTDDDTGKIYWHNTAAAEHFGITLPQDLSTILGDLHAAPEKFVTRLHDLATATGSAEHHLQLQNASRVYHVKKLDGDQFLWRITLEKETDTREDLPFECVQFSADGELQHVSAALRKTFPTKATSLVQFFKGTPPRVGQITPVTLGDGGETYQALRLKSRDEMSETVLLLSTPDVAPPTQDSGQFDETHQLQYLALGLAQISVDGQLTYVNDEAKRLLRLREKHLPMLSEILEGLGRPVSEWIADVASGRIARSTEVLCLKCNLSEMYLKVTLTAPVYENAEFIVVVFSDVTEMKSLEAKFIQSQKMQAIGQLAGGVAHDFNNLLTAISGHCDLLLLRHDRSDLNFPDLMQIQQNANRAAALVRQLLALSRQQTLKFVTLDLHETMEDVIHLLNRLVGEKVTLTLRHGKNVEPIRSDKRQFEQVLMNLVVNASDALPLGGEIRIQTETRAFPKGLARDNVRIPPGTYTLIKISDDGVGIPQELIEKVFEPFFTTKRVGEGTGLGLSTVYGIVKQSGGYIFVDSEEGVGTNFTLYFTAQKPEAPEATTPRTDSVNSNALDTRHALILLVEDETPVRSFAARALELQGHRVIEADCGEAALQILQDTTIRPDCFVTDVIMPGLDGPSWIAQIRDRFPETPVIFMSGYAEDSRVAAQARISQATFLGKPFSLAEFTQAVNTQLREPTKAA